MHIRLEGKQDHKIVENLTREAFWNLNFPGCGEHLVIHNLRKTKEFVKSLDFVAVQENIIIGNIVYAQAKVKDAGTEQTVLTFGPISVLPAYQRKGVGSKLINHTLELAKEKKYKAVIIYGDPEYYKKFGFRPSKKYNITNKDGKYPAALLVLELYSGALDGIKGIFDEGNGYEVEEKELEEFEKNFSPKDKLITKTQEKFKEIASKYL